LRCQARKRRDRARKINYKPRKRKNNSSTEETP
jgi:hypothetical protein